MSDAQTRTADEAHGNETTWYDLIGFQRDLLLVAVECDEVPKGLTLLDRLQDHYSESINQARLYTNLDDLTEVGLIERESVDGRTNAYRVTDRGRELLEQSRAQIAAALGVESL